MSAVASAAPSREDGLLIRALGRGETAAIEPLLERHLPRVYGLLRMTLPSGREVESALSDTFCEAVDRASDPLARANPEKWLASIALEQIERRPHPRPPISLEERRRRDGRASAGEPGGDAEIELSADSVAGVTDSALATLIRTLDLHSRQAIVLGVIADLDDVSVARTIGCEPHEVEGLKRKALAGLTEKLAEHERREAELARAIAAVPYKLRPHPVGDAYGSGRGPAGNTAIDGQKVRIESNPAEQGLLNLVFRALKRVAELFRHHRDEGDLDHDSGETSAPKTPEPTPTLKPFEKPGPTPTTRGFRNPKLSPGVAVYTMPRGTPTTQRLSNRRPPLQGGRRK